MAEAAGEAALLAAMDALPCVRVDRAGRLVSASADARALFGGDLPPDLAHAFQLAAGDAQALLEGERWQGQAALLRGALLPVPVKLVSLPEGDQRVLLILGDVQQLVALTDTLGDINSDLVNLHRERAKQAQALRAQKQEIEAQNEELIDLNAQLEALDREKLMFYAQVNHELRTPLNSIIGFAEDALDGLAGPLTDEQRHYFQIILASGRRQLGLVGQLLEFSRLRAGQEQVATRDFALAPLVDGLAAELAPLLRGKAQALTADVPPDLTVHADPGLVHQVLANLVGNAQKYAGEGGRIAIKAARDGQTACVEVADDGPGIAAEALPHVFDPFFRAAKGWQERATGTGLGLAIARQLVERLGGRIEVDSAPGEGTRFWVWLPTAAA